MPPVALVASRCAEQWGFQDALSTNEGGYNIAHYALERLRLGEDTGEEAVAICQVLPLIVLSGHTPHDGRPAGSTALHMACSGADHQEQRAAIVKALLKRSVDIDAKTTTCGSTPLMKAAGTAAYGLVKLLLEHRASVNEQNYRGQTAVDMAKASNKKVEAVLLEAGGQPSSQWRSGQARRDRGSGWSSHSWHAAGWR